MQKNPINGLNVTETNYADSSPRISFFAIEDGATLNQVNKGPLDVEQGRTTTYSPPQHTEGNNSVAKKHIERLNDSIRTLERDFNRTLDTIVDVKKKVSDLNKIISEN